MLNSVGRNGDVLKPFYMNVKSGNSDNREGVAAKIYWNELFGNNFKREIDGGTLIPKMRKPRELKRR